MRSIKKLKSTGKAVAGSALLVGATLTGAAGLASAQDSGSMDLGDYPQPFVDEDGEVDSTIVVGDQAQTADVVGAINVAGSLGNAAFMEEEVDVDISGAVSTWSAENGMTLNRDNDNLFVNDATDAQENDFDENDLDALQTTTVQSVDSEEVELEFEAMVGNQAQEFEDTDESDDPVLQVNVPTSASTGNPDEYLLQTTIDFSDAMDFGYDDSGDDDIANDADEALEDGDELELFGTTYTFSDESTDDELVLYGSSESFEVNTGETTTTTVDDEEHTFGADYVSDDGSEATITVDGNTESVEEGDSVSVSGQEVRVTNIYRTGPDGQGRVQFSIGSEELTITNNDVEIDGDSVDGVDVNVEAVDSSNPFQATEAITFAFAAEDSDEDYIGVGETYEDPLFGALEFHYGGLNPDASTEDGTAETFDVEADEDGTAQASFWAESGDEVTQTFADVDANSNTALMADSDEKIATVEGETLEEDDYVVLNQNEDSGLYQVTSLDVDLADVGNGNGEASVTLQNVATGQSIDIEEDDLDDDEANTNDYTLDSESVDGMDHDITFTDGSPDTVSFMGSDDSDGLAVFPAVYTQEDGAVAFSEETTIPGDNVDDIAASDALGSNKTVQASNSEQVYFNFDNLGGETVDVEFFSAGSSTHDETGIVLDNNGNAAINLSASGTNFDFDRVEVDPSSADAGSVNNLQFSFNYDSGNTDDTQSYNDTVDFTSFSPSGDGGTRFDVRLPSTTSSNEYEVTFNDGNDGEVVGDRQIKLEVLSTDSGNNEATVALTHADSTGSEVSDAAVTYVQPEDDEDTEDAYTSNVDVSDNAGSDLIEVDYTQEDIGGDIADLQGSLDDEDVDVGYNLYGSYVENDKEADESESFTLNVPGAQSTAGMAVTGMDGSISAEGGGSGSATTQTPTGWPDSAALDSEVSGSDRDQNMILVGGPAVNTLTEELAQDNKTWTADEYDEDTWVLDLVEGFSEDTHALVVAGHSAPDTRAASSFISNYADNADELAGETTVSMTTSASQ
jgi:hypothetical protein